MRIDRQTDRDLMFRSFLKYIQIDRFDAGKQRQTHTGTDTDTELQTPPKYVRTYLYIFVETHVFVCGSVSYMYI